MNNRLLGSLLAVVVAASAAAAEEKTFTIDPVYSAVLFRIRHLYTMFTGRVNIFSGTISGDPDKPSSMRVTAEVDVASVDTANEGRDSHLRAADFFNVEKFPKARFTSIRTVVTGDREADVHGDLELLGKTLPVVLKTEYLGYGIDHREGHRIGFHAEVTIDREAFGMTYNSKLPSGLSVLGNQVKLILEIEAIETAAGPKTLAKQIDEFKSKNKTELPPEVAAALAKAKSEILAQKDIEGLKPGDRAPRFNLPDISGKKHSLAELLKKGPVVLVFYRGEWCPFCNLQLRALEKVYPDLKRLGASLVGVTPQKFTEADTASSGSLTFPLLSDTSGDTMRAYRLLYRIPAEMQAVYKERYNIDLERHNGEGRWELPVTATYIVDRTGVVRAGMVDLDYTKRMEPAEILEEVKKL